MGAALDRGKGRRILAEGSECRTHLRQARCPNRVAPPGAIPLHACDYNIPVAAHLGNIGGQFSLRNNHG